MTTTINEYIPPEFWEALRLEPTCMTLRAAIADRLEELGEYESADCIRWTIAKGVQSSQGTFTSLDGKINSIPTLLWCSGGRPIQKTELFPNDSKDNAVPLRRLCWRWSLLTPEQRQECWNWTPLEKRQ